MKITTNGLKIGPELKNAQNPTPAIAAMCGCTPWVIEEAWRDGSLKYLIIGGGRVSTIERIAERAGGWSWDAIGLLQAVIKFGKAFFESLTLLSGSAITASHNRTH